MKLSHDYLKGLIQKIDFAQSKSNEDIFNKKYSQHDNYTITINFKTEKIDYPKPLTLGDRTTSNFEASENFVVLECLDRLLEKGYKPENITLEKKWGLGHRDKGKADVFVKYPQTYEAKPDCSDKSYLIIECKTWGDEFNKEFEKTLKTGGQLLSYYKQETKSELLCLYTSIFEKDEVRYTNRIIEVKEKFQTAGNKDEVLKIWKEDFQQSIKYNGIFDEEAAPYSPVLRNLKRKNLVQLQEGDSGYIYNRFAEILRHNVVSDKPNAFNKMFNLILAKIVDEDRGAEDELHFQWKDDDNDIELQKRLNDLYKEGMNEYLKKKITDLSDEDLERLLSSDRSTAAFKTEMRKRITELRLYKNNEFSFKEVFNEKSFKDNAIVVKQAVKLLQNFQLRYSHKQQFLSNFFELLLSNTLKQEAGQYFTPIPIAKFIVNCIPIKEIVDKRISEGKEKFLPTIIDYACGSGHFLTEAMDELQHILENVSEKNLRPSIKTKIEISKQNPYGWALDFVYGVEKDYRLSKIAKVSCFLNGDGLANIIHADGLDSFKSDDYKVAPLLRSDSNSKDNQNFDVLLTNPPYSVSAFIKTLPKGKDCFNTYDNFTDQSKEIEVLFIERMKQLVKETGYVGIILPSSILSNANVYTHARAIIFKYFKLVATVEFSSSTFMATGTNTVTLFLQRRNDLEFVEIQNTISQFFSDKEESDCNGIEEAFSLYLNSVYETNLPDYLTFVNKHPSDKFKNLEIFKSYQTWYNKLTETKGLKIKIAKLTSEILKQKAKLQLAKEKADQIKIKIKLTEAETQHKKAEQDLVNKFYEKTFAIEQEKMLYFFLAYNQETLLIKSKPIGKKKKEERKFLGYKFSNRRGDEGLKIIGETKLYSDINKRDESKASSYIYKAFLGEPLSELHKDLHGHLQVRNLWELMKFDKVEFDNSISISFVRKSDYQFKSRYETKAISKIEGIEYEQGLIYADTDESVDETKNILLTASNIDLDTGLLDLSQFKYLKPSFKIESSKLLKANDIFICTSSGSINHLGKSVFIEKDLGFAFGGFCGAIRTGDYHASKFLYYLLNTEKFKKYIETKLGSNINNLGRDGLLDYVVPFPDLPAIKKIVAAIAVVEREDKKILSQLTKKSDLLEKLFSDLFNDKKSLVQLSIPCDVKGGKRVPKGYNFSSKETDYPYLRVTDFHKHGIDKSDLQFISKEIFDQISNYTISKDDVYISIAGTIGLVGIVPDDFDGKSLTENAAKLVIKDKTQLDKKFLMYCLACKNGQDEIKDLTREMGTPKLALERIETIKIPLIKKTEQDKLIKLIAPIEKDIKDFETYLKNSKKEKEKMILKWL